MLKVLTRRSTYGLPIAEGENRILQIKQDSLATDMTKGYEPADRAVCDSVCSCYRSLTCNHLP